MGILGQIVGNIIISGIAKAAIDELPGPIIEESPMTDIRNGAMKALGNIINIWDTPCELPTTTNTECSYDEDIIHKESVKTVKEVATSIYDKFNHIEYNQVFVNHLND